MVIKIDEAAKTVIEGLKSSPLALPLVVINMLCLGVVAYILYEVADRTKARDELIVALTENCKVILPK
jgi:hypothetical protein